MADPTPLLSTIAGSSAGLVAIIGGLLVARYVGLDSEQRGAERLYEDVRQRRKVAEGRLDELRDERLTYEINLLLDDDDVAEAIVRGTTQARRLMSISRDEHITVSAENLQAAVDKAKVEADAYMSEIRSGPLASNGTEDGAYWSKRTLDSSVRREVLAARRQEGRLAAIWVAAYDLVWRERLEEAAERRRRENANRPLGGITFGGSSTDYLTAFPGFNLGALTAVSMPTGTPRRADIRRGMLDEEERAQHKVEDLLLEEATLKRLLNTVGRPKGLWSVLTVLAYGSVVGIMFPVLKMLSAPTRFDGQITALVWGFISSLVALLIVLGWQAWRLSRSLGRREDTVTNDPAS